MKVKIIDLMLPFAESIPCLMLGNQSNNLLEVVLKEDVFVEGWEYLVKRLKRDHIEANLIYKKEIGYVFKVDFKSECLEDELATLISFMQKQYYKVNPQRRSANLLVKPTHRCNLNCNYCYEASYRKEYKEDMTFETLENIIKKASEYTEYVQWIWHGGEATLMGAEWFRKAHKLFEKYPMLDVGFSIMSNGILLTSELTDTFDELGVKYGVSYDYLNQLKERTVGFERDVVFENMQQMKKEGKRVGTINVVTKDTVSKLIEMYEFYKKEHISVSFNIVFNSSNHIIEDIDNFETEFYKFFKYWVYDTNGVEERTCMGLVKNLLGDPNDRLCTFTQCQYGWLGINASGQVTPCDRVYPKKYFYNNINEIDHFSEVYLSEGYRLLCEDINKRQRDYCVECGYFALCGGLCNATHAIANNDASRVDENICTLYRSMFNVAYSVLRDIEIEKDKINPFLFNYLINLGYIGMKDIIEYTKHKGVEIELTYEKGKLNESSEFKVFYGINSKIAIKEVCFEDYLKLSEGQKTFDEILLIYKKSIPQKMDVLLDVFKKELILKSSAFNTQKIEGEK